MLDPTELHGGGFYVCRIVNGRRDVLRCGAKPLEDAKRTAEDWLAKDEALLDGTK
jgi:hypothetical protein